MKPAILYNNKSRKLILIYGSSGAGKTVFGGSSMLHEDYNSLFVLAVEKEGAKSINTTLNVQPIVYPIDTLGEIEEALVWLKRREQTQRAWENETNPEKKEKFETELKKQEEPLLGSIPEKPTIIKTIMLDSVTAYQKMAMNEIMGNSDKLMISSIKKSQYDDWGKNKQLLSSLINRLQAIPNMNIICTALAQEINDGEKILPAMEGSFRESIGAYFDIVGYLEKRYIPNEKKTIRVIFWEDPKTVSKNRFLNTDEEKYLQNPSIITMEEQIKKQEGKK